MSLNMLGEVNSLVQVKKHLLDAIFYLLILCEHLLPLLPFCLCKYCPKSVSRPFKFCTALGNSFNNFIFAELIFYGIFKKVYNKGKANNKLKQIVIMMCSSYLLST